MYEFFDELLIEIQSLKDKWIQSESESDKFYELLLDIELKVTKKAIELGLVDKMSKSSEEEENDD